MHTTPATGRAPVIVTRRISSTDPNFLTLVPPPVLGTSVSESSVFCSSRMDSQDQVARALVQARRLLEREVEEFTEDDVCASRIPVLERDLSEIKRLKNEYQDRIEDYLEKYADIAKFHWVKLCHPD